MKDTNLPAELLAIRSFLPEVIAVLEEHIPYASALVTEQSGFDLQVDSKQEVISEKPPRRGIVFTLFNGRYFQEWATDNLDKQYLLSKAKEMGKLFADVQPEAQYTIDPGGALDKHFDSQFEIDPDSIRLTDMVLACKDLMEEVGKMDHKIVNVSIHYQDGKEYKVFANRNRLLSSALTLCGIQLVVIGYDKRSTQMNFIGSGGVTGFEAIRFKRAQLQELIADLNLLFESSPLEPGDYPVVSSPEVSGILAHEAFGHGVELDMFAKRRAKAKQFMNKAVAADLVDMYDDPSMPGLHGSYFFDDEGAVAAATKIIDKGVLKQGLSDLRSATVLGLPRTANGRRESFERKVYARMSNTFFGKGTSSFEDMLAALDNGLYLKKSSSGMEDPKGWGIQVGINLAQEVRKGKLTSKVYAPLTMTGYVPDLLHSITMVGRELGGFSSGGFCGKGHKELVRVSSGGPHLKFTARLG